MINKEYLNYFFLLILVSNLFLPELGVVDITNIQFPFLSVTQSLIFIYLFLIKKDDESYNKIWGNKIIKFYFLFILISGISIISSYNKTEAVVDLLYYFTIFITILNYSYIFLNSEFKLRLFFFFTLSLLTLESFYTFWVFISSYSFESGLGRIRSLQGFSYNQNINAFSLVIKTPILIYFILNAKKGFLYFFALTLFLITSFNVLIIASRGAILALIIIFVASVFFILWKYKVSIKGKRILILTSFLFLVVFSQDLLYVNNGELKSQNRITNFEDSSISYRKNLYLEAIEGIKDFPLTGVGIGNWKILSIKYAKDRIEQYQVPYHAHNDFLHIGVETGIFGFLIYGLIFFQILYTLIKHLNKGENSLLYFFLFLSIIVYVFDSSFNFPRARVYSQVNFILILSFIISSLSKKVINKKGLPYKYLHYLFLTILPFASYVGYKVYNSSVIQKKIIYDFNENPTNYKVPLNEIEKIDPSIPTISSVCFPIKISLALYQFQEREYEKAYKNALQANSLNQFLGVSEYLMAKISQN